MKKLTIILIIIALSTDLLSAQSNIENILQEIETNNLHLKSLSEKKKAKEYDAKASLQLENPHLGAEYLVNSPTSIQKYGFELTQSFDFPTVYGKRKALANEQIKGYEYEYQQKRRLFLFNAKKMLFEIIYNNKLKLLLDKKENSTKLAYEKYQKLFDEKAATVLDLTKARLEYFNSKLLLKSQIENHVNLNEKLKQLNGSTEIILQGTIFPVLDELPDYEFLKNDYIQNEIKVNRTKQSVVVSQKEMQLVKNNRLPSFELGYKYANEEVLQFNGVTFGVSIPLWQGRKEVKASQSNLIVSEINFQYEQEKAESEIYVLYNNYLLQKNLYEEYVVFFETLYILENLDKQLELGRLTSSEYYLQLNDYYDLQIQVLEAEFTYYQSVLALEKYKL